jgi:hypothetical protein
VSIDDESTIRWVPLLQRSTKFIAEYPLDFFEQNFDSLFQYDGSFLRLQWIDARNSNFPVSVPIFDEDGTFLLDEAEVAEITSSIRRRAVPRLMDGDGDGTAEEEQFFISLYIDRFMPSVVLSIVAEYFNLDFTEVKVVLGENIILPNPRGLQLRNTQPGQVPNSNGPSTSRSGNRRNPSGSRISRYRKYHYPHR